LLTRQKRLLRRMCLTKSQSLPGQNHSGELTNRPRFCLTFRKIGINVGRGLILSGLLFLQAFRDDASRKAGRKVGLQKGSPWARNCLV